MKAINFPSFIHVVNEKNIYIPGGAYERNTFKVYDSYLSGVQQILPLPP